MEENITPGDILDDRYEIRKILKSEKNYILYEGFHQKIEKKVLIQELITDEDETSHILARARLLGDFSGEEGLFHVKDQFTADCRSYIVFECPDGVTLREYLQKRNKIGETHFVEMILPLIHILAKMEKEGIEKLTVSTDTIYVKSNGSLGLFPDLIAEVSDVKTYTYMMCEILYEIISGNKPQNLEIRILFDELDSLEKLCPKTNKRLSMIIDRGMQIDSEQSYLSITELAEALEEWLKTQAPPKGRWIYRVLGSVLLGILVCIGLLMLYRKYEEEILFWGTETETFILTASDEMSKKDYIAAVDVIKTRIKKLSKSARFLIKDDDGWIWVTVSKKFYDKYKENDLLKEYLSLSLKLEVEVVARPADQENNDNEWLSVFWRSGALVELEPDDIVSVKEIDNSGELGDWESFDQMESQLLEVTVTDEAADVMKDYLERKMKALQDTEEKYDARLAVELGGVRNLTPANIQNNDWHTIYINETEEMQLESHILQEQTFDEDFDASEELSADWIEKLSDVYTHWKNADEIADPSVCLEYTTSEAPENDGDYYYSLGRMADKLECLKIPYVIGTRGEDRRDLIVKVRQKDMTEFLAQIISENARCKIEDQWGDLYSSVENISRKKNDDGDTYWSVTVTGVEEEDWRELADAEEYIYLTYGGFPFARTRITEEPQNLSLSESSYSSEYELCFEETWLGDDGNITKDMDGLVRLINRIYTSASTYQSVPQTYVLSTIQYTENGKAVHEKKTEKKALSLMDGQFEAIKKAAEEIDSYVDTEIIYNYTSDSSDGCELVFTLHMDLDSSYGEEAVNKILQLWTACKLTEVKYENIWFFIGEKGEYPFVDLLSVNKKQWSTSVGTRGNKRSDSVDTIHDKEFKKAFEQAVSDGKMGEKVIIS